MSIAAHQAIGNRFYRGYALGGGGGMGFLLPEEISHSVMAMIFGSMAVVALCIGLEGTSVPDSLLQLFQRLRQSPALVVVVSGCWVVACTYGIAYQVLAFAPVTDDEGTFQFIAQTLRTGHLTAPSPGDDLTFFREQFVVLTPAVRYGKYPIGFPALLALGQWLHAERVVVPLLCGMLAATVFWIGRRASGSTVSILAVLLFAISPQVMATGATLLSQPAAALSLVIAVGAILESDRRGGAAVWLAVAGLALGVGLLIRPLPGGLFVIAAAVHLIWKPGRPKISTLMAAAVPVALGALIFLLVNRLQAGSAMSSGYLATQSTVKDTAELSGLYKISRLFLEGGGFADRAMSIFSGIFRLNLWLFGWPVSLLFLGWSSESRSSRLLWLMVVAELSYRLISPKAGVGATGPIYLFEVVPLLCVLSAQGMVRVAREGLLGFKGSSARVGALAAASTLTGWIVFVPARLDDLSHMGVAQRAAAGLIAERGVHHALVFHQGIVPPFLQASWAYYPRRNSPTMDDDILYMMFQRSGDLNINLEFWKRRFPDRSAWFFGWTESGEPYLVDLASYVAEQSRHAR